MGEVRGSRRRDRWGSWSANSRARARRRARGAGWATALLLGAIACTPSQVESDLAQPSRTRQELPGLVVHSPYGEAATAAWAERVQVERELVSRLLQLESSSLELRLLPVENDADRDDPSLDWLFETMHPGRRGYAGWGGVREDGDALAVVYVPADELMEVIARDSATRVVRHELVHVFSPRAGVPTEPRWFAEGLARAVEERVTDGQGALVRDTLTPASSLNESGLPPLPLAGLLDWSAWDGGAADGHEHRRYSMAASFVDFLLSQRDESPFPDAARAIAALPREELLAQEEPWRNWLAAIDPLQEVELLARSARTDDRARALLRLRVLVFDRRWPGAAGERGDAVALAALAEPELRDSAFTYLGLGRARALEPEVVEGLLRSQDDELFLMGAGLSRKRGEAVDDVAVQQRWDRLPRSVQARMGITSFLLGLKLSPRPARPAGSSASAEASSQDQEPSEPSASAAAVPTGEDP
jgi:hypothetical protein